jgi:hypothetical protein
MLAPSVPILPNSSIDHLVLLSSRAQPGSPVCAGFPSTGVQARHLQFPFVTILRMAQRRQRGLSSLDFESTPAERTRSFQCSAKAAFRPCNPRTLGSFAAKSAGTRPQNERPKSSRMRTYTKRGEGGASLLYAPVHFVFRQPRAQMP